MLVSKKLTTAGSLSLIYEDIAKALQLTKALKSAYSSGFCWSKPWFSRGITS